MAGSGSGSGLAGSGAGSSASMVDGFLIDIPGFERAYGALLALHDDVAQCRRALGARVEGLDPETVSSLIVGVREAAKAAGAAVLAPGGDLGSAHALNQLAHLENELAQMLESLYTAFQRYLAADAAASAELARVRKQLDAYDGP